MGMERTKPNVIVCMTTQWRAQSCGYAGDANARTPRLDALAKRSVDFRQAVTPHPFGVFARAAFLTGKPCPENGLRNYYDSLPQDARMLAHEFGELGYETAFFGKWQLYERDPAAPVVGDPHALIVVPEDRRGGFGFWEGFESGFLLNDGYYHGTRLPEPTRIAGYQSDVIVERFSSYLSESKGGRPLFSLLSFDAPHPPYAASSSTVLPSASESLELLPNVPLGSEVESTARCELAGYYAHIEATDRAIGRLIDTLKGNGQWENTVFVFTSAHGDMHGSHGVFRKGWPYEEAVRVPLLVSWPQCSEYGTTSDGLVSLLDLGRSLLGLASDFEKAACSGSGLAGALWGSLLKASCQRMSMPSVPPFAKQCPYVWQARRTLGETVVRPENGKAFSLEHLLG